ncbi:uncharacterized protein Dwil_GK28087 [Drosophila willistoni]|uniref:MD-2-related lipid-recognition domain-containing protein n=1 Tax=Drosophila willistoni TaxID=7260 RepID=A0A0Q9WVK8_DROWI|nr:uncharacterized protein Dwil_GK28087 [Drosophila willistoni]
MVNSKFEFTNIKCYCPVDKFCHVEYCYLKSVNRSYKYFSARSNIHQNPITNFTVNLALLKRYNGYKPFLYNFTVDGCKFLGNSKAANPVSKYFFEFFAPYMNANHKCPYDHDLIIEKLPASSMDYRLSKLLPFPEGDYLFNITWLIIGIPHGNIQIYGSLS